MDTLPCEKCEKPPFPTSGRRAYIHPTEKCPKCGLSVFFYPQDGALKFMGVRDSKAASNLSTATGIQNVS